MAERYFVSDWHLFHANILKFYPDQPWKDIRDRDEALVDLHNERVKPEDHFYMLGDATLLRGNRQNQEKFIRHAKRFNGHGKIFLGNHDHFHVSVYLEAGFEDVMATWRDDLRIVYSHFPIHPSSMGSALANVHGHTHAASDEPPVIQETNRKTIIQPYVNISVEKTEYKPLHLDELLKRIRVIKGE